MHGEMSWLERNFEARLNPAILHEGTKTIISLATFYYNDEYEEGCGVSRYAVGRDYHKVLKKKGNQLIQEITNLLGKVNARAFVDSAPVMEREWARRAGLGWIGKNACLIIPRKGSWLFLSEIMLDVEMPPDEPHNVNLCGSCSRCINACPTDALLGDGLLDAKKCISYLSIEVKGSFEKGKNPAWQEWIFGCDICQEVCPWNREITKSRNEDFEPRKEVMDLKKMLDTGSFDSIENAILGTPLKRTGVEGLIRNNDWIKSISD